MSSLPGGNAPEAPVEAQPYGEVFDRGYQHYAGRRAGRMHAIRALVVYSIKRGLGIKKRWTAKIIPFALYAIAFLPAVVFIGVRSFLGPQAERLSLTYFDLYGLLSLVILIFAAATAPEMLCDDRRQHVLQVYFARPISRADYLLSKVAALGFLIGSIAFLPALLLFVGNTFLAARPNEYFGEHLADLGRILLAGGAIGLFYTAIPLAVATYIDRKGIAAATSLGGMLVASAIVSALFNAIKGDWHRYLILANPALIPSAINRWIFGTTRPQSVDPQVLAANLDGGWYLLAAALIIVVCAALMYRRYLRED